MLLTELGPCHWILTKRESARRKSRCDLTSIFMLKRSYSSWVLYICIVLYSFLWLPFGFCTRLKVWEMARTLEKISNFYCLECNIYFWNLMFILNHCKPQIFIFVCLSSSCMLGSFCLSSSACLVFVQDLHDRGCSVTEKQILLF